MRSCIILCLLFMSSCSMPETKIYSLYVPAESGSAQSGKQGMVTLRVQSPRYLAQPYIAHRLSPYQLEISGYAKWESPPADMVRDIFQDALAARFQQVRVSHAAAAGSVALTVNLKRFERVDESYGELELDAEISAADGKNIRRMTVRRKVQLETKDYAGLAKALSSALSEAVREVIAATGSGVE
ncbi:MAG: membrane integrity-associated transporter subunit PqiC [Nitrospirae bacterium]|nr:membrane integrity-associated transporter subunit PqiC [Nitrospirota bacterium]